MASLRPDDIRAFLKLFFCFALLAKGGCLQCEICMSNSTSCMGPKQNCTKGDTCVIAITKSTMDNVPQDNFVKRCGVSASCDMPEMYYQVGDGQTFHQKLYCCTEEACSTITPTLPTLQKNPKGKKCPACNSLGEPCPKDKVECYGKDAECFILTKNLTHDGKSSHHVMKGCSSKNMCTVMEREESRNEIECTLSGAIQVLASFLMTFSSLWILKLLV